MSSTPANPLLGTWHLCRWEIAYGDGRAATLPYGPDAMGLILYTANGWMNACIARGERPRLSGDSMRKLPTAKPCPPSKVTSAMPAATRYAPMRAGRRWYTR